MREKQTNTSLHIITSNNENHIKIPQGTVLLLEKHVLNDKLHNFAIQQHYRKKTHTYDIFLHAKTQNNALQDDTGVFPLVFRACA